MSDSVVILVLVFGISHSLINRSDVHQRREGLCAFRQPSTVGVPCECFSYLLVVLWVEFERN